jgi:hypothetical protein
MTANYQVEVKGSLWVHLENGDSFEAGPDDFRKFRLVEKSAAYMAFHDHLYKIFNAAGLTDREKRITDARLNPIRYLVELAINYPELLDHPDNANIWTEVVAIERFLREHMPEEEATDG